MLDKIPERKPIFVKVFDRKPIIQKDVCFREGFKNKISGKSHIRGGGGGQLAIFH